MCCLVLASASPRRRELLSALGIPFRVVASKVDETLVGDRGFEAGLQAVALRKASQVGRRLSENAWVLAADTAVVVEGEVFGKPRDRADAGRMLRVLSNRVHRVVTAVAMVGPDFEELFSVGSEVRFRALTEPEIDWYTSSDEPYDKAGGYAVQGRGAFMVMEIRGSYTNVVGLPMSETVSLLEKAGLAPWSALRAGAG